MLPRARRGADFNPNGPLAVEDTITRIAQELANARAVSVFVELQANGIPQERGVVTPDAAAP